MNYFQGKQKDILNTKTSKSCLQDLWVAGCGCSHLGAAGRISGCISGCCPAAGNAAALGERLCRAGGTSADSRGSSNFARFFPLRSFYHSFTTKQINSRKRGIFSWISASSPALSLGRVPGTRILLMLRLLLPFLLDHGGEEMWIFCWFWWLWCSFRPNISPDLWWSMRMKPIRERRENTEENKELTNTALTAG